MLKYQVNFRGGWQPVDQGIVLIDGRLAWWLGKESGIAPAPYWMLTESSRRNPVFRQACWDALTDEEKRYSLERRGTLEKGLAA